MSRLILTIKPSKRRNVVPKSIKISPPILGRGEPHTNTICKLESKPAPLLPLFFYFQKIIQYFTGNTSRTGTCHVIRPVPPAPLSSSLPFNASLASAVKYLQRQEIFSGMSHLHSKIGIHFFIIAFQLQTA